MYLSHAVYATAILHYSKNSLNSYEKTLNDLLTIDSLNYDICAQIQKESKNFSSKGFIRKLVNKY